MCFNYPKKIEEFLRAQKQLRRFYVYLGSCYKTNQFRDNGQTVQQVVDQNVEINFSLLHVENLIILYFFPVY